MMGISNIFPLSFFLIPIFLGNSGIWGPVGSDAQLEGQSWDVTLIASFSEGSDGAILGVRLGATSGFDSAYDIPKPPAPPESPYVRVYFYYPGQTPGELHRSCLPLENLMEWPLCITYAGDFDNIILSWGTENIPAEYSVYLLELDKMVANMKEDNSYVFQATTGDHNFIVRARKEVGIEGEPTPSLMVGVMIIVVVVIIVVIAIWFWRQRGRERRRVLGKVEGS